MTVPGRGPLVLAAALALAGRAGGCARDAASPSPPPEPSVPSVVLFVGDGFGVGAWNVGREYARSRGELLELDDARHVGFLETRCAGELVTDSAAASTAWATGELGRRFAIGSRDVPPRPNLFERLHDAGRAYGLVTTARVTGGTPAPFYAREANRYDKGAEEDVARQLLAVPPTVVIGGGRRHFRTVEAGGTRTDGRDLLEEARDAGVAVLEELTLPLPTDRPVLALLAGSSCPHETDRREEPDLKDLVLAAIDRLAAERKPWFLLVEEGRIENACRDHDGPSLARDVVRLDRAVRAVLDRVDPESTLVVVTATHATDNPTLRAAAHPESLDVVSMSVERMERRIFGGIPWRGTPRSLEERALPVLDAGARHTGLEAGDLDRLLTAKNDRERATALGHAISRRFGISFLSYRDHLASPEVRGKTSEPVPVRAWGVRADEVEGTRDHARFGLWLADVMRLPSGSGRAGDDAEGANGGADN